MSGRRELNPVYIHPMDAYYRYTTARVGVPGIEPGLHAPEACVLPVYYTPMFFVLAFAKTVHPSGFEPETFRM